MRSIPAAALAVCALALLAAGCGGGSDSSEPTLTSADGQEVTRSEVIDTFESEQPEATKVFCQALKQGEGNAIRASFERGVKAALRGKSVPITPSEIFVGLAERC